MSRRDDPDILILRMADELWERYCKVGLGVDLARYRSPNRRANDQREALKRTALSTYRQFCRRHNLETGIDERQV